MSLMRGLDPERYEIGIWFEIEKYLCEASGLVWRGKTQCRGSYADIGKNCEIIILCVPSGDISKSILFGTEGVAAYAAAGTVVSIDVNAGDVVNTGDVVAHI